MSEDDPLSDWRRNPFFVLELTTDAPRIDIERMGQKLLALLEVGSVEVASYQTPFGSATRDSDLVRQALAALRDPNGRILHELWADVGGPIEEEPDKSPVAPWEGAGHAVGWARAWRR
jgi:hypothetical protein